VFAIRQVLSDTEWPRVERLVRLSFWGLNLGLALMVITNLFPGGVLQLLDVLQNGYWHARSIDFLGQGTMKTIEWLRLPGDIIFISFGALPLFLCAGLAWRSLRRSEN
jgi:nitric oxide reductase subunit B